MPPSTAKLIPERAQNLGAYQQDPVVLAHREGIESFLRENGTIRPICKGGEAAYISADGNTLSFVTGSISKSIDQQRRIIQDNAFVACIKKAYCQRLAFYLASGLPVPHTWSFGTPINCWQSHWISAHTQIEMPSNIDQILAKLKPLIEQYKQEINQRGFRTPLQRRQAGENIPDGEQQYIATIQKPTGQQESIDLFVTNAFLEALSLPPKAWQILNPAGHRESIPSEALITKAKQILQESNVAPLEGDFAQEAQFPIRCERLHTNLMDTIGGRERSICNQAVLADLALGDRMAKNTQQYIPPTCLTVIQQRGNTCSEMSAYHATCMAHTRQLPFRDYIGAANAEEISHRLRATTEVTRINTDEYSWYRIGANHDPDFEAVIPTTHTCAQLLLANQLRAQAQAQAQATVPQAVKTSPSQQLQVAMRDHQPPTVKATSFIQKIGNTISNIITGLVSWFKRLFSKKENVPSNETPQSHSDSHSIFLSPKQDRTIVPQFQNAKSPSPSLNNQQNSATYTPKTPTKK